MNYPCTRSDALALLLLAAIAASACQDRSSGAEGGMWGYSAPQPNAALQALVDGKGLEAIVTGPQMAPAERARLIDQVRRFYQSQNYRLVWIDGNRATRRYAELEKVLNAAEDHGLPPELYRMPLSDPAAAGGEITAERAPELDAKATASFFRYSLHLTGGRLDPRALQSTWTLRPQKPDVVNALTSAVNDNNLVEVMHRLEPPQPEYQELRKALGRYRGIAAKG